MSISRITGKAVCLELLNTKFKDAKFRVTKYDHSDVKESIMNAGDLSILIYTSAFSMGYYKGDVLGDCKEKRLTLEFKPKDQKNYTFPDVYYEVEQILGCDEIKL